MIKGFEIRGMAQSKKESPGLQKGPGPRSRSRFRSRSRSRYGQVFRKIAKDAHQSLCLTQ